jgi:L-alanine-DL-glutamate epimerase-like enolase superfamily enzyme
MKITGIETFAVDNGFTPARPWLFCAIRTDAGLIDREFGSDGTTHGLIGLVADLGKRRIGRDPTSPDKHALDLYRAVRQAPYGATQQEPHAVDVAKLDVQWQGLGAARRVADLAESYDVDVAPHNYNGHLPTFRSPNLGASASNVVIMESDPEQTPFREELFTVRPEIRDGHMTIPSGPGWGTELSEAAAKRHAWNG